MMKKLIKTISVLLSAFLITITACDNQSGNLTVYIPDGAPALSMVKNIKDNDEFEYKIVGADKIEGLITSRNPIADVCILPLNNASNLLSDKEDYYMLGVVTHGNFYFLSKDSIEINRLSASSLIGKTVGVVQLKNIPGLAFKACLNELNIPFKELSNGNQKEDNKVNIKAITPNEISSDVADIYLAPSPVADVKAKNGLQFVGSLNELFESGSFPQAVLVAKRQVVQRKSLSLKKLIENLNGANDYLSQLSAKDICSLISGKLEKGINSMYNENNLTPLVIERANVNYISVAQSKNQINAFIQKIKAVSVGAVKIIPEGFYYGGVL